MQLDKAIEARHSTRKFSSLKKVNWRHIIEAIDAANKTALAGNIPSLRFILVDDKEKISKLAEASQQLFFENVPYAVVVCTDPTLTVKSFDERGQIYCRQQAGAAIQNFLLKITDLGLASCWVGAFADDIVKRILNLPENILVEAILPVSYEMERGKVRKKPDLDNVLFFNKWKNKFMREPHKPEAL